MANRPIGVFDSGVGGLSVLRELTKVLPNEDYLYFGDSARVPYGEKTPEELLRFSREILDWFKSQNVKMVLMACNTSSAVTLKTVQEEYDFPILGLIDPTADYILDLRLKKVGLMATNATINSKSYPFALRNQAEVIDIACPGLVELVENNLINTPLAKDKLKPFITPLIEQKTEKIILGCTHYPFLRDIMCEIGCDDSVFIDPAICLAQKAKQTLSDLGLIKTSGGFAKFFVSSNPENFVVNSKLFLKNSLLSCENVLLLDLDSTPKII